jgi:transcriptional regulator with XRE-family HTH domain
MALAEFAVVHSDAAAPVRGRTRVPVRLNRIREVRHQQGVSLRTACRHLGLDVKTVRQQEEETADLKVSDLYRWQQALDVPVGELLTEEEAPLSRPVMERAQLVRIMKTAAAIQEQAPNAQMQRMAQTLCEQLTELMPELKEVAPWHTVGQRRSLDEMGRAAENVFRGDFGDYDDGE